MVLLNNQRKSKKGFSLLELLLVLGIIAALVVAALLCIPRFRLHKEHRQNPITLPPYRQVLKRYTRRHQALLA